MARELDLLEFQVFFMKNLYSRIQNPILECPEKEERTKREEEKAKREEILFQYLKTQREEGQAKLAVKVKTQREERGYH